MNIYSVGRASLFHHHRHWHPTCFSFLRTLKTNTEKTLTVREDAERLHDEGLKYRYHPGIRKNPCKELPLKLHLASLGVINRHRGKRFKHEIDRIRREFYEVFIDTGEENSATENKRKIQLDEEFEFDASSYESDDNNIRDIRKKFSTTEPYNEFQCAAYMAARLSPNYTTMKYLFNEIRREEPDFVPQSLFDFGSGVGSTIWAADEVFKGTLNEVFCVDLNENMNDLSRELLAKGTTHNDNILDRTFYRQFLPVKHRPGYDLVVSGFSLLEFYDTKSRIYLIENLWKKTNGMLVIVEHGSRAGFKAIIEARNFLLQISKRQLDPLQDKPNKHESNVSRDILRTEGSLVAPCPHELICPRVTSGKKKSFCNFVANYPVIDYGQDTVGIKKEKFSYLIMKKNNFQEWSEMQKHWPRCVEPQLKKSKHSICRVCTRDGKLEEFILSKSQSEKNIYGIARKSQWGDKLPADIVDKIPQENIKDGLGNDEL